jgi:hypothetical protein
MSIRYDDDFVTLWNYADDHEGVVETREWGYCTSETCQHWSHDPRFEYYTTTIIGRVVWEGECGEELIVSGQTGRVFFTRYKDNLSYGPTMFTEEIRYLDKPLPPKTSELVSSYPVRHKVIRAFWDILDKIKEEKSRFAEAANGTDARTSSTGVETCC